MPGTFDDLTMRAFDIAEEVGGPYRPVLALLTDCISADHGREELRQRRGASFKQLAYIAGMARFTKEERQEWYGIAEFIPLSERHASHLIDRLKKGAR